MGVNNFWKLISEFGTKCDLKDTTVAVDTSQWVCQLSNLSDSQIVYIVANRIVRLLHSNLRVYFVIDGKPPKYKINKLRKRCKNREDSELRNHLKMLLKGEKCKICGVVYRNCPHSKVAIEREVEEIRKAVWGAEYEEEHKSVDINMKSRSSNINMPQSYQYTLPNQKAVFTSDYGHSETGFSEFQISKILQKQKYRNSMSHKPQRILSDCKKEYFFTKEPEVIKTLDLGYEIDMIKDVDLDEDTNLAHTDEEYLVDDKYMDSSDIEVSMSINVASNNIDQENSNLGTQSSIFERISKRELIKLDEYNSNVDTQPSIYEHISSRETIMMDEEDLINTTQGDEEQNSDRESIDIYDKRETLPIRKPIKPDETSTENTTEQEECQAVDLLYDSNNLESWTAVKEYEVFDDHVKPYENKSESVLLEDPKGNDSLHNGAVNHQTFDKYVSDFSDTLNLILEIIRAFSLPVVYSPSESDAQCGFMYRAGLISGVISEDSDMFLFGAEIVYRGVFKGETTKYTCPYSRLDRFKIAYLLGCDYKEKVANVGVKTVFKRLDEVDTDELNKLIEMYETVLFADVEEYEFGKINSKKIKNTLEKYDVNDNKVEQLMYFLHRASYNKS